MVRVSDGCSGGRTRTEEKGSDSAVREDGGQRRNECINGFVVDSTLGDFEGNGKKSLEFLVISKAISDCAALLPLKSLKIPDIFSQSLTNRLKLSQLPTHLCTHFCPTLRPTSLQNPSPFLPSVSDPHCIRPTPLPFTQSFLSYPLSYLTASYGMASA